MLFEYIVLWLITLIHIAAHFIYYVLASPAHWYIPQLQNNCVMYIF